jgi:hypothetical protein
VEEVNVGRAASWSLEASRRTELVNQARPLTKRKMLNDVIARDDRNARAIVGMSERNTREEKSRSPFRVEVPAESAAAPADIANPAISFSNLP